MLFGESWRRLYGRCVLEAKLESVLWRSWGICCVEDGENADENWSTMLIPSAEKIILFSYLSHHILKILRGRIIEAFNLSKLICTQT